MRGWCAPFAILSGAALALAAVAPAANAQNTDRTIEVRIPFEGSEIVGYLRLPSPSVARPVPLVLAISGLDSRKETVAETYAAAVAQGLAFFAVDSPGTGEAPLKASDTADRMYSRVLD